MARVQYHSTTRENCWQLPLKWLQPHIKLSWGVWMRKTIDRPTLGANRADGDVKYQYTPLSPREIRLFSLNPGEAADPITGSLTTASLSQPGSYEALSYVWGGAAMESAIQVDKSILRVTENLASALSFIRSPTETRVLWIDAICINQSDVAERGHQVEQMRDTFAAAERVVIWLGPSTEHSEMGMKILDYFIKARPFREGPWQTSAPSLVAAGLADILQRAWFQRFWVVQEGALAKEVVMYCGLHQVTWSNRIRPVLSFLRAVKIAVISPQWQEMRLNALRMDFLLGLLQAQLESGPDADLWAHRPRTPDLLDFAYSMRDRKATDLRDRIYALLGLANTHAEDKIVPDYSKPAEDAYAEFARKINQQTQVMCDELERSQRRDQGRQDPTQKQGEDSTALMSTFDDQGGMSTLDAFMEQACSQSLQNVRDRDFDGAARLLENAAMLLRGEKFHKRP